VIGGASHLSTSPQESNEDSDVGWWVSVGRAPSTRCVVLDARTRPSGLLSSASFHLHRRPSRLNSS